MKKQIINEELNYIKYLFDYKSGVVISEQESSLMEYDIDDDNIKTTFLDELKTDTSEMLPDVGNVDLSNPQSLEDSIQNMGMCGIDDASQIVDSKLGNFLKQKFGDKYNEVRDIVSKYLNKFIDVVSKITDRGQLKKLFREFKSKKAELESQQDSAEIKEFLGTSMTTLVTIGSLSLPQLVVTIGFSIIAFLLFIALLKTILCAFNIKLFKIKKCRVRSFELGQCK